MPSNGVMTWYANFRADGTWSVAGVCGVEAGENTRTLGWEGVLEFGHDPGGSGERAEVN